MRMQRKCALWIFPANAGAWRGEEHSFCGNGSIDVADVIAAGGDYPDYFAPCASEEDLIMLLDILRAFIVGGIICSVGQLLIDYTKLTPARILTGFVVAGVILSAVGVYGPLVEFAGAGATVPLTGFGHTLAEGIRKTISDDGILGIFTGGMTAASGGITAALLFGVLAAAVFPQRDK